MLEDVLAEIRDDRLSGAAAITRRAAEVIVRLAESGARDFPERLRHLCQALPAAQPMMASLLRLAHDALHAGPAPEDVRALCRQFLKRMEEGEQRIAGYVTELLPNNAVVLTHSSSATVRSALLHAHAAGKVREVICTESRPLREGATLAGALAASGIPITLIIDAGMASVLNRVDVALVGADAVSARGVTNKTGTLTLAHLCRAYGKALYVLCGEEKFLPPGCELPEEPPHDAAEIAPDAAPGVTVVNRYFELTPRELVTGIITGEGLHDQS